MVSVTPTLFPDYEASSNQSAPSYLPIKLATMLFTPPSVTLASSLVASSTSLVLMVMTPPASTAGPLSTGRKHHDNDNAECDLLGPFALLIQASLGALALLSLVYKRWRERPQRPVKIWAFDASKQVVGSMLLHIANLLMSMLSSGQLSVTLARAGDFQANPCSFYLLNLAIDTTVGIPILIVLLRLLTHAFSLTPLGNPRESIQSGNYGRPPKAAWWLKQSFIYFIGLLGMKFCVFIIFQLCPWIIQVGDWALRWTEGNEKVQVFFVMLFFPVIMNALQYYIIDSFIKNQKPPEHEQIPSEDEDEADIDGRRRSEILDHDVDGDSDLANNDEVTEPGATSISEVEDKKLPSTKNTAHNKSSRKLDEYDPERDGERNGDSSGGSQDDGSTPTKVATEEKGV